VVDDDNDDNDYNDDDDQEGENGSVSDAWIRPPPRDASRRGAAALPPRDGRIPKAVARAAIAAKPVRGGSGSVGSADTDGLWMGPTGVVAVADVLAPRQGGTRETLGAKMSPGVAPPSVPSPACVVWVAAGHELRVEAPLGMQ